MSIWYAIPSCRPRDNARKVLLEWVERGYSIATLRQGGPLDLPLAGIHMPTDRYLGWAQSINLLVKMILEADKTAEWIVTGGDDYLPVTSKSADEIAGECKLHFYNRLSMAEISTPEALRGASYGVMQPTGDRYGDGLIDTAAASPWMGQEWCRRSYMGNGPLWEGYFHYFADTELQHVAQLEGVFWQRPDLVQEHKHWSREPECTVPEHLIGPLGRYAFDQAQFEDRKLMGFPGHRSLL